MKKREMTSCDGYEKIIARTVGEIESIRPIWEQMQRNQPYPVINADIDRYLSVLESQKDKDIKPYVTLLKHGNHPKNMVIGRVENHQLCCRVGYKIFYRPSVRCLTIVYGGILGEQNEEVCAKIVAELQSVLRSRQVDMVYISHLKTNSLLYHFARNTPNFLCRGHFARVEPHWRISIPKSMEEFFASRSKNSRKDLKSHLNKLGKKYPEGVRIHTYSRPEDVPQAIKDAAYISKNSYQFALGVGFADTPQKRILLLKAASKGWFRGHILYINEEPAAFEYTLKYGRIYFGEATAYDSKWKDFNVGTVILLKVLEILCQEGTTDYFDFGFGDADYKSSYADKCWQEGSLYIFAPRAYPVLVNMLQSAATGLSLGLNRALGGGGLTRRIKRYWRNLLQKGNKH
jgi:hypothetical protein